MAKIRHTELFYSIQGEGRYMGVPSVFLRTFGCNLRCPGFNTHPVQKTNAEVEQIIEMVRREPDKYPTFESLPLARTGCDSYPSVYPEFKSFARDIDTNDLAENIISLLPHRRWMDEHLVITGGEPLLGWQRAYPALLDHEKMRELRELTFETNGTSALTPELAAYLQNWTEKPGREVTFSVSAKLSCSGHTREDTVFPDVVVEYQDYGYTYLKFVVATEKDVDEALEVTDIYRGAGFNGPVYLMAVGGVNDVYNLNARAVAELAMQNGLRYSDRLHLPIFGNSWNT